MYIFKAPSRELVPKFIEGADRLVDIGWFFRELIGFKNAGPGPIVADEWKRESVAKVTLGCDTLYDPLKTCFPNDEVLLGQRKSDPPFS